MPVAPPKRPDRVATIHNSGDAERLTNGETNSALRDLTTKVGNMPMSRLRRLSLNQILLVAVLIALLPTALLSIYLSFSGRNQARELIVARLEASASATASFHRDSIEQIAQRMRDYAQAPEVRAMAQGCDTILASGLAVPTTASNFARLNASGQLRCSAIPTSAPMNVAGQRWWQEGRASGRLTFSGAQYGEISRRSIILAMLPVSDGDGVFDGAVVTAIDASWVQRILASTSQSDNVMVALVDGGGQILLANRAHRFPVRPDVAGQRVNAMRDDQGQEWLYASSAVWGDQLYILYAEPMVPLVAPLADQLRISVALPIATIILSCLAIWLAMEMFAARWLARLHSLIAQFRRGDYAVDLGSFSTAPSDIARLAEDMHRMAQSIEQRDNSLRSSANARLALVGEVNHRVKNNLQMIMSLISLQSSRVSDPLAKSALDQIRMRISALALVYRLLYEEDSESEQGNVDVDRLMPLLVEQLHMSSQNSNAAITVEVAVGVRPVDEVIPLAMFVVEVLTNAQRHGFPGDRSGSILLSIAVLDGETMVSIVDNGVGYRAEPVAREFGTTLIAAYAKQLSAAYTVDSDDEQGTRVYLTYRSRPLSTPVPAPTQDC